MSIEIRLLNPGDAEVLASVASDVFDRPIDPTGTRAFLDDSRHHLAVAVDGSQVVGYVSAVHYVHPDKPHPEMWINEVSVAPTHRRQGIATALLNRILQRARELQCSEAWVLTERDNHPAVRLYSTVGSGAKPEDALMFTFDPGDGPD